MLIQFILHNEDNHRSKMTAHKFEIRSLLYRNRRD